MVWIISFMPQSMGSWGSSYDACMDMFAAGPPKGDEPGDRSIYIHTHVYIPVQPRKSDPIPPSFMYPGHWACHPPSGRNPRRTIPRCFQRESPLADGYQYIHIYIYICTYIYTIYTHTYSYIYTHLFILMHSVLELGHLYFQTATHSHSHSLIHLTSLLQPSQPPQAFPSLLPAFPQAAAGPPPPFRIL